MSIPLNVLAKAFPDWRNELGQFDFSPSDARRYSWRRQRSALDPKPKRKRHKIGRPCKSYRDPVKQKQLIRKRLWARNRAAARKATALTAAGSP